MAQSFRVQFSGALHHVTARGNARQKICLDDADRHGFLELLAAAAKRAGIPVARASQIQTEIERDGVREPLKALSDYYKVRA
jgi:hypothetical protein